MAATKTGPGAPKLSQADFIEIFERVGPHQMARDLQCDIRGIYYRRNAIEKRIGRQIKTPENSPNKTRLATIPHPASVEKTITDGVALVGSDAHYWPGAPSTAHRAFVKFCQTLKPKIVIKNGDVLDGASISRHPPIGWESRPSLIQEIEVCSERMDEIRKASPGADFVYPLGNHDSRFEQRIATVAPEYARIHGVHLHDHIKGWESCWVCVINSSVVIKHRFKSGIHAPHNNTMWAGKTIVTGHLHSLKVMPVTDYNGTRFGVDCGTLADPYGQQFADYTELSPVNWRSGFIVLTFRNGELMWPEIVYKIRDGMVGFRGEEIEV